MNVLINHCFCIDSHWGGKEPYWCRSIVSIDRVPEGKDYYDPPCPDWALIEEHPYASKEKEPFGRHETLRLRSDAMDWLTASIKDRELTKWQVAEGYSVKGWDVGTDAYNSNSGISFSVFFARPADAMRFVKHWSVYKNPISFLNYFKDIRMELNPKTGKMKRIP